MAVGPAVAGAIADATGSFVPAFLLASVVAVLGAAAAATLGSHGQAGVKPPDTAGGRLAADRVRAVSSATRSGEGTPSSSQPRLR
jgi:hypothetical protein